MTAVFVNELGAVDFIKSDPHIHDCQVIGAKNEGEQSVSGQHRKFVVEFEACDQSIMGVFLLLYFLQF